MIKVRDLIIKLLAMDPEAYAILQKDGEGNSFSPLSGVEQGYYIKENSWRGEFYDSETEALSEGESIRVVVFYPIN